MSRNRNTRSNNPAFNPAMLGKTRDLMRRQVAYDKWRGFIENLVLNRMDWSGLPDTVDERALERFLARYGVALFYDATASSLLIQDTKELYDLSMPVYLATRVNVKGVPDVNDNYHEYDATGPRGSQSVPKGSGVLIYSNTSRRVDWPVLEYFAEQLAELELVARTNRMQQRTVKLIKSGKGNYNDVQRVIEEMDRGTLAIAQLSDPNEELEVDAVDISTPYLQDKFWEDKENLLSELYLYLGITNVGRTKEAYQNYSETEASNDAVARVRQSILFPRQQACEAINKKFGLNLSVKWRTEPLEEMIQVSRNENPTGV